MFLPLRSPLNLLSKCFERRERKVCEKSKLPEMVPTAFCISGLLSCPGLPATDPVHSFTTLLSLDHSLSLCLSHSLLFSLSLTSKQVVISSQPAPIPLSNPSPPTSFSVCAKWGPCTLPPVHPLHCGPSRLLLKVLSFNHFFKKDFFFQGSTRSQITSELLSDSVTI